MSHTTLIDAVRAASPEERDSALVELVKRRLFGQAMT